MLTDVQCTFVKNKKKEGLTMFCPNCGKEIGDAKFCPECGYSAQGNPGPEIPEPAKQPKKKKTGCLVAVIVAVILFGVIGSTSTPSNNAGETEGSSESSQVETPDFEILNHEMVNDGYYKHVKGEIRNNTDKTYSYAQIEVNVYNGDKQLGSTFDNINNWEPGAVWVFDALIMEDGVTSYKIVDVTAF